MIDDSSEMEDPYFERLINDPNTFLNEKWTAHLLRCHTKEKLDDDGLSTEEVLVETAIFENEVDVER